MPAALSFWQLPGEERELLRLIAGIGPIVAYPSGWVDDKRELLPRDITSLIESDNPRGFGIGLEQLTERVRVTEHWFDKRLRFAVLYMDTCVIDYARGSLVGNRLTLSNICAWWSISGQEGKSVLPQDPEFVQWGKKVFQLVRKHSPEWYKHKNYRATRKAKEAFTRGEIELVEY